jgi:ribosomal protein L7/L12
MIPRNKQPLSDAALEEIVNDLYAGKKIAAIKAFRVATGAGLTEAKDAVEAIEQTIRTTEPERLTAKPSKDLGWLETLLLLLPF